MKLEKTLIEMVGHFTPSRASEWLRFLFSSFETDAEPIAVDATKNESAYFAEARVCPRPIPQRRPTSRLSSWRSG